jgi:hypothetical protein
VTTEPAAPKVSQARPLSLTIAGWYLAISGPFMLLGLCNAANPAVLEAWRLMGVNPLAALANSALAGAVYTLAGIGILRGGLWGRRLFLVGAAASTLIGLVIQPLSMAAVTLGFGLVTYGLIAYVLLRPDASAYFAGTYDLDGTLTRRRARLSRLRASQYRRNDWARLFGVAFAIGAGFWMGLVLFAAPILPLQFGWFVAALFGAFALVCGALAVGLWGPARWRAVAGWILAPAGLMAGTSLLMMFAIVRTPGWQETMRAAAPDFDDTTLAFWNSGQMIVGVLVALLVGGAGVMVLMSQYERDREALDAPAEIV